MLVEEVCLGLIGGEYRPITCLERSGIPDFLLHLPCDAWISCDVAMSSTYAQYDDLLPFCT